MNSVSRQGILYLSLALFALSCLLPAVNHKIGVLNLISGFLFPFYPLAWPYLFFWSANILYYIDVRQFRKGKDTYPVGIMAFMLAVCFFIFEAVIDFKTVFTNQEMSISIGYYVWTISFIILPIYQITFKFKKTRVRNAEYNIER